MRIDDLNRTPLTQGTEKTDAAAQKRAEEKDGSLPAAADQANVSELAQALASRDPQRLEQLRLDVQSGKYNVSAEAVAKAIIEAHAKE
jgi:anti-sigma28 factor (negative regulator of flagellin synthesis)